MSLAASLLLLAATPAGFVNASKWGWSAADATSCLQQAVDSGERRVYVDRQAGDWIVEPIHIRGSDLELVFGDGVRLRAKKGAFKGKSDMLVRIEKTAKRIVIRGEGDARFVMNKPDYQNAAEYVQAEWRHTLGVYGTRGVSQGVAVSNLTFESSGGDGVYLNNTSDVVLENLVCRDHHRQGISVIGVENLLVRSCAFLETGGTPPKCGLDVEPNSSAEMLENVLFEDCDFHDNESSGVSFYLKNLVATSRPVSVTFRNCRSWNNRGAGFAVTVSSTTNAVPGTVLLEDCRVWGNAGAPLNLRNAFAGEDRLKVVVRNSQLDARAGTAAGIVIRSDAIGDFGNLEVEGTDLLVGAGADLEFSATMGSGAGGLKGVLRVIDGSGATNLVDLADWAEGHRSDPDVIAFAPAELDYRDLVPLMPAERLTQPVRTGNLRGKVTFLQYLPGEGTFPISFSCKPVRKGNPVNVKVTMKAADGTALGNFAITESNSVYAIRSTAAGVRRFEIDTGSCVADIASEWPGCGFEVASEVGLFKNGGKRYYFAVPPGRERIRVMVAPAESCSATLFSADGEEVDSLPKGTVGKVLASDRASDMSGLWSVRFPYMQEDMKIRVGAPGVPVVSAAPEAVLAPRACSSASLVTTVKALSVGPGEGLVLRYDPLLGRMQSLSVTDTLAYAAPVEVRSSFRPVASTTGEPARHPFLTAPAGQRISASDFRFVPDPSMEPGNGVRPQRVRFEVGTDAASGRDTLYAVIEPIVELVTGDYGSRGWERGVLEGSAFAKPGSWSDGRVPHAGAHYLVRKYLHTIPEDGVAYDFPGLSLILEGSTTFLFGKDSVLRAPDIYLSGMLRECQHSRVTIGGGRLHLCSAAGVVLSAYANLTLTVASELDGRSDMILRGESGTGSPHGWFAFRAPNTNWFGRITMEAVPQNKNDAGERLSRWTVNYNSLRLSDGRSLGGPLPSFDCRALEIRNHNELYVEKDAELDASANRGLFIGEGCGRIQVVGGATLACRWPITMDATLFKTGAGTLALGGGVLFPDGAYPGDQAKRTLVVTNGCLKALAHDCVDGLTVDLAQNNGSAALAVDFAPSDRALRRYGFYNARADAPFVKGQRIRFRFDAQGGVRLGTKQGVLTVRTSVADWVAAALEVENPLPAETASEFRIERIDDPESGLTTFVARFGTGGLAIRLL